MGPGWWQASDGRFYPPESVPGPAPVVNGPAPWRPPSGSSPVTPPVSQPSGPPTGAAPWGAAAPAGSSFGARGHGTPVPLTPLRPSSSYFPWKELVAVVVLGAGVVAGWLIVF